MPKLIQSHSPQHYQTAKTLFQAYVQELNIDLSFQSFAQELETLEQQYSPPTGALVIAYTANNQPIGCFGIRQLEDTICELKRMYITLEFRGKGIGKLLLEEALKIGKELGYQKMRLDTLPTMHSAIGLYRQYGFYEIAAYRFNPIMGTLYFESEL